MSAEYVSKYILHRGLYLEQRWFEAKVKSFLLIQSKQNSQTGNYVANYIATLRSHMFN